MHYSYLHTLVSSLRVVQQCLTEYENKHYVFLPIGSDYVFYYITLWLFKLLTKSVMDTADAEFLLVKISSLCTMTKVIISKRLYRLVRKVELKQYKL